MSAHPSRQLLQARDTLDRATHIVSCAKLATAYALADADDCRPIVATLQKALEELWDVATVLHGVQEAMPSASLFLGEAVAAD